MLVYIFLNNELPLLYKNGIKKSYAIKEMKILREMTTKTY